MIMKIDYGVFIRIILFIFIFVAIFSLWKIAFGIQSIDDQPGNNGYGDHGLNCSANSDPFMCKYFEALYVPLIQLSGYLNSLVNNSQTQIDNQKIIIENQKAEISLLQQLVYHSTSSNRTSLGNNCHTQGTGILCNK